MKLPKSFRPNKDLEENIKQLLSQKNRRSNKISKYVNTREEFKEFWKNETDIFHDYLWKKYTKGETLANSFEYGLQDLHSFAKIEYEPELGMYISALAEKLMKGNNSMIFLDPSKQLVLH